MKRKGWIILAVVAVVVLGAYSWLKGSYNDMVSRSEAATAQLGNIENQYQRRADLIPNLVNTVKGYSTHEEETLTKVVEARAKATSITLDAKDLTEENLARYQQAQNELSGALKSLLAVTEAYPDLKANENFLNLQAQLEGTENRIATERKRYTESVREYNTAIKKFPTTIYAGWFGFDEKPQFKAEAGAEKAPEVKF